MTNLQTLSEPINQTSFARAMRLGMESLLDAVATVDSERAENFEMARRWYMAAEKYADNDVERGALMGLSEMISRTAHMMALTGFGP
jgi:hypothetical protein